MTVFDPGYGPLVETTVRVASWNVWARYGPWERRAPAIEATLRAVGADIVALQEVWDDGARNQARELAEQIGYCEPVFAANLEREIPPGYPLGSQGAKPPGGLEARRERDRE